MVDTWDSETIEIMFRPGVGVTGYAVTCVTVEPVGYASFLRVSDAKVGN